MARKKKEEEIEEEIVVSESETVETVETKETEVEESKVKETKVEAKIVIPEVTPMNAAMYSEGMMDPYEIAHAKAAQAAK